MPVQEDISAIASAVADLSAKVDGLRAMLQSLASPKLVKEFYSTAEVADRVGRSEYQTREWCRLGQIKALKRRTGRGRHKEWAIPHAELLRYESEGLLPPTRPRRAVPAARAGGRLSRTSA